MNKFILSYIHVFRTNAYIHLELGDSISTAFVHRIFWIILNHVILRRMTLCLMWICLRMHLLKMVSGDSIDLQRHIVELFDDKPIWYLLFTDFLISVEEDFFFFLFLRVLGPMITSCPNTKTLCFWNLLMLIPTCAMYKRSPFFEEDFLDWEF